MVEFLGAQLGLASPFIFVLGVMALVQARRDSEFFLPALLIWPAILYFFVHALHDRVQGNWPCFLIRLSPFSAPSSGSSAIPAGANGAPVAAPVAAFTDSLAYIQALTGIVPLGARDPLPRLLGTGFKPVADSLADAARHAHAGAILTTDYESTAWLRFYEPGLKVIQLGEVWRYPGAPMPDAALTRGPLLYFVERKRDQSAEVGNIFPPCPWPRNCESAKERRNIALYRIYLVDTPKALIAGRMP